MKLRKEPQPQYNSVVILGRSGTELRCLQVLQTVCAEAMPTGAQQAGESRAVLLVGGFRGSQQHSQAGLCPLLGLELPGRMPLCSGC